MTDPNRFAIFDIDQHINGHTPMFLKDAVFVGSRTAIMGRIIDSRAQRDDLAIINDAAHASRKLDSIRQRERDVAAREDSVAAREDAANKRDLRDAIKKLDTTAARMDEVEQQENERIQNMLDALPDPDNPELDSPPGNLTSDPPPDKERYDEGGAAGPGGIVETRTVVDPEDLAHGPKAPSQPIAVSLASED